MTGKIDQLLKDVWPSERDLIERPDRLKYVRKLIKTDGCVFCSASKAGPSFDSLVLYHGEQASIVMNKYPYNPGHILIIPNSHQGDLIHLSKSEFNELHLLLRCGLDILKKEYPCEGVNIGMNLGTVAGAGIPDHLHYHVIPRWVGDTNFFPLIAQTKVLSETLEQSYQRLLPYFKNPPQWLEEDDEI